MTKYTELQSCLLSNFGNLIHLDESNYVSWRFMLESMLVGCDLMGYIDGSVPCPPQYKFTKDGNITSELTQEFKEWRKNDSALMTLLAGTLSHSALAFIVGSNTSKEVWFSLYARYGKLSKYKAFELKRSMQKIRKGEDNIDTYLERFKTVRDQLCVAGIFIPDYEIVSLILNGLPSEYITIKAIIRAKDLSTSLPELRLMLLDVEADCKIEMEKSTASASSTVMPSPVILSSQYMGNFSTAPAFQNATSNVGFLPNVINTNMTIPHGIQWNCSPSVASYDCSVCTVESNAVLVKQAETSYPNKISMVKVKSSTPHPLDDSEELDSSGLSESRSYVLGPGKGVAGQKNGQLISQSGVGTAFCPSPQNSLYFAAPTLYCEAKQSFTNTEVSECTSSIEKAAETESAVTNSCELTESRKTSLYRGSTGSDVSDESSSSSLSNNMYKPHKVNDVRWEAIQAYQDHDGMLSLNHYKLNNLVKCRQVCESTNLCYSLPLIPPG